MRVTTAALGMLTRALKLRTTGTWSVSSTRTSTAAPGMLPLALGLRGKGTWSVSSTRTSTAALGRRHVRSSCGPGRDAATRNGCPWGKLVLRGKGLECLQYAHEHSCPWDTVTCARAAGNGQLECLRYARARLPWNAVTCAWAARQRAPGVLAVRASNGCPWDADTCAQAAENGQLECLRYARNNGCPWDAATCAWAAWHGHLECLQYAHEHGCPWDTVTCARAAGQGHLECLQYAHEHGCPWNAVTCAWAADKGHLSVSSTRTSTAAPGMLSRALGLRKTGTWSVCGMRVTTAVHAPFGASSCERDERRERNTEFH